MRSGQVFFAAWNFCGNNGGEIRKVSTDGVYDPGSVPGLCPTDADSAVTCLTTDDTYVYWSEGSFSGGAIKSVLQGGGAVNTIATLSGVPSSLIKPTSGAGAGKIFWLEANVDTFQVDLKQRQSTGQILVLASGLGIFPALQQTPARALAVDDASVYFFRVVGNDTQVAKVPIGGGDVTVLATGADVVNPMALAVDETHVYWTELGSDQVIGEGAVKRTLKTKCPEADFTANPASGPAPLNVQFTDTSTGTVNSWAWTFGDGASSTIKNPSHTYNNPGNYTVTLTVTGGAGCSAKNKSASITVTAPSPPVADFTANPTSGLAPLNVQFTDTSTGSITGWLWEFGDGGTSTSQNPSHTYNNPGTFNAKLTVTGPGGSSFKTATITVTAPPPPAADFSAAPIEGMAPLTVQFTDASTGAITSRAWDFGDGGTSAAQSPSHLYKKPGSYNVTLTVTGPGGANSKGAGITVYKKGAPKANFTVCAKSGTAPLQVQFTDASTGWITGWSWAFGDGGTSTEQSPSYVYSAPGKWKATLTVTGPGGTKSKSATIKVTTPP